MSADAAAIFAVHLTELPASLEARVEELLIGVPIVERRRRRTVAEACAELRESRSSFYRIVEACKLRVEREEAAPRRNGRRGASRIFTTLEAIARYRASVEIDAARPIEKAGP